MLIGDNSILQKVIYAKNETEKAQIIESAQTDILGKQTDNNGMNITKEQLATILNKYFKPTEATSIPDEVSSEHNLELTTIDEKYKIYLSELYKGSLLSSTNDERNVSIEIGDYVTYEISYKDMYSDYTFVASDGWRIIDKGIQNSDGTYRNVKIISTGIPATLSYVYNTYTARGEWWGEDSDVSNLYNNDSNIETILEKGWNYSAGGYPGYYVAAGLALYKNFKLLKLPIGTYSNYGYSESLLDIDEDGAVTGNDFLITSVASEVHNVTLAELNKAREFEDETSLQGTDVQIDSNNKDGALGLFYLRDLSNENVDYGYTISTVPPYWLATPSYPYQLRSVVSNGAISVGHSHRRGIRPVISLKCDIKNISEGHWEIVE